MRLYRTAATASFRGCGSNGLSLISMPTYEFRCPDGHDFEKFYRSIGGAEAQAVCPVCGKASERRMSAAGFAFKGSGFYLTDYGKNAHRDNSPATSSEAAGSTSANEAKEGAAAKGEGGSVEAKADAKSDAAKAPAASTSDKPEKKTETAPKATESKPASPPKASGGE